MSLRLYPLHVMADSVMLVDYCGFSFHLACPEWLFILPTGVVCGMAPGLRLNQTLASFNSARYLRSALVLKAWRIAVPRQAIADLH